VWRSRCGHEGHIPAGVTDCLHVEAALDAVVRNKGAAGIDGGHRPKMQPKIAGDFVQVAFAMPVLQLVI
jgi:hypothetical protein